MSPIGRSAPGNGSMASSASGAATGGRWIVDGPHFSSQSWNQLTCMHTVLVTSKGTQDARNLLTRCSHLDRYGRYLGVLATVCLLGHLGKIAKRDYTHYLFS